MLQDQWLKWQPDGKPVQALRILIGCNSTLYEKCQRHIDFKMSLYYSIVGLYKQTKQTN